MKRYSVIIFVIILICFLGLFYDPLKTLMQNDESEDAITIYYESEDVIRVKDEEYKKLGIAGDYIVYKYKRTVLVGQAFEKIYEDEENEYYLPTQSSGLYLLVNGNEILGLKEALDKGKVSIKELENVIKIYTEQKTDY